MEWVQARDGTEARRTAAGIEVRMIGKADSTVYKDTKPCLKEAYPALYADSTEAEPPDEPVPTKPAKKRRGKK